MKKRIISAIIMLLLFIPILILGDIYYTILGCILACIALWEMVNLEKNIPLYMKLISYVLILFLIVDSFLNKDYLNIKYYLFVIFFFIYSFSIIINKDIKKYTYKDGLWLFIITFLLGIMFRSFIHIRLMGMEYTIYCFLISILTDTFALFGGKMFGKHKLAPYVSPNKTIEGSIVGSIFGTVGASIFYYFVISKEFIFGIIILSLILSILGQIGDLFFSSIKRYHGIKDYSDIIPGHGGILDRLDSVLFVNMG